MQEKITYWFPNGHRMVYSGDYMSRLRWIRLTWRGYFAMWRVLIRCGSWEKVEQVFNFLLAPPAAYQRKLPREAPLTLRWCPNAVETAATLAVAVIVGIFFCMVGL